MPGSRSTRRTQSKGNQEQGRRSMGNERKKLDLTTQPSDKDPLVVHTDPGTDSRHHAISDAPSQLQSEETGYLTGSKSAMGNDKEKKTIASVRLGTGTRRKVISNSKGEPSAATASKGRSDNQHAGHDLDRDKPTKSQNQPIPSDTKLQRLKLTMPRNLKGKPQAQRSSLTRKKYTLHLTTEVDWNEDLRPTDDEDLPMTTNLNLNEKELQVADGDAGTSVSTPDPEPTSYGNHEIKTKQKRKVSKAQTASEKRRRVASARAKSSSGTKDNRPAQLPLTVAAAGHPGISASIPSKPNPSTSQFDTQSFHGQSASAHHTGTETKGPPTGHGINSSLKDTANQQREIIVISSSPAPSSTPSSDNDIDALQSEAYRYRVIGTGSTGRGKSVGQKLRDALHGVELHTQLRPAIETSLKSTDRDLDGIGQEKTASPSSRMHSTTESQGQDSRENPTVQHGQEDALVLEAHLRSQFLQIEDQEPQGETVHQDRPDNEKMITFAPELPEESSSSEVSVHGEYSSDETHDEFETNSPHAINPEAPKAADALEYSQASIDSLQNLVNDDSESYVSSRNSVGPEINGFSNGHIEPEKNKDNQTPESQQPLLTRQGALQHSLRFSGPVRTRASIVDANGSPRLFEEAGLLADRTGSPLKDVQTPESSSSVYDQNSQGYSSDDELTSSKYQCEMFLEYGIETESMKRRNQSAHPRGSGGAAPEGRHRTTSQKTSRQPVEADPSLSYNPLFSAPIITGPSAGRTSPGQNSPMVTNSNLNKEQPSLYREQRAVVPLSTEVQVSGVRQPSQSNETSPPDWISALQTAQKSAHDLLQETNQRLSTQLAAEQETINQVLQIYRQGCNQMLDDLSQAHRVRMDLYKQQMASVREQHREICQDLIRGFEGLDDRVQEGR